MCKIEKITADLGKLMEKRAAMDKQIADTVKKLVAETKAACKHAPAKPAPKKPVAKKPVAKKPVKKVK